MIEGGCSVSEREVSSFGGGDGEGLLVEASATKWVCLWFHLGFGCLDRAIVGGYEMM